LTRQYSDSKQRTWDGKKIGVLPKEKKEHVDGRKRNQGE